MKAAILKKMILESHEAQLRYLPQSVQLEESTSPRLVRATMLTVSFAVLVFVFWAALADIKEIARAPGEIVPQGFTQLIQHLDGGMIVEILIEEGAAVKKGDVLLKIDDGGAREDLAQAEMKARGLEMQAERLRAQAEKRTPNFSKFPDQQAVKKQKLIFDSAVAAHEQDRQVIESQISQKTDELNTLSSKTKTLEENLKLDQEILGTIGDLNKRGAASKNEFIESQKNVNSLQGEIAQVKSQIAAANGAIAEFKNRLAALETQTQEETLRDLEKVENDLAQTKENETKLTNRVGRLELRAPEDGIVKGLKVNTIGEVVQAGETLMEIIPTNRRLVVEAQVSPRDIGYIKPGAKARIKVSSFDFSRYGAVEGTVDFITATTFMDERGQPYYRARVVLSQDHVGGTDGTHELIPGMTVEADIITGEKSVLGYLLKPVQRAVSTAMTER